jgi:hypothetical protein
MTVRLSMFQRDSLWEFRNEKLFYHLMGRCRQLEFGTCPRFLLAEETSGRARGCAMLSDDPG